MLFDLLNFLTFEKDILLVNLKYYYNKPDEHFPTSMQILFIESVYVPDHNYLSYFKGKYHGNQRTFLKFWKLSTDKKSKDFIEFKVHLIHIQETGPSIFFILQYWFYAIYTLVRWQSKTLLAIDDHRSIIARKSVFNCNLLPVWQQMAIQNTVSDNYWTTFVNSIYYYIIYK